MENKHIVARFDKDIEKIKGIILTMGALVNSQIKDATDALMDFDTTEIEELIATDRKINDMKERVHNRAERLIALRQPMALDLRQAMLAVKISGELERLGDHAKSTARRVPKLSENANVDDAMNLIREMSTEVQSMLTDILIAYRDGNVELSEEVRDRDAKVDANYKAVFKIVVKALTENSKDAETLVHMILLARHFERTGDHVVNMSRQVNHIVTGEY